MMKWISVEDRVPEHSDYVLVFCKGLGSPIIGSYDGHFDDWSSSEGEQVREVTYWMLLPGPPVEEEK